VLGIVFGLGRYLDAPTAGHDLEFLDAVRVPERAIKILALHIR